MRYRASTRPGFHERVSALFPAPRQRWIDAMSPSSDELADMRIPTLLVHGRDDKVIPVSSSEQVAEQIALFFENLGQDRIAARLPYFAHPWHVTPYVKA